MPTEPLLVVLRLLAEEVAAGRLVGQVEEVRTGEVTTVHDAAELLALLRQRAVASMDRAAGPSVGRSSDVGM